MTSKHLIDPELMQFFRGNPPSILVDATNLAQMRPGMLAMSKMLAGPRPEEVAMTIEAIPAAHGPDVRVLVFTPRSLTPATGPLPAILHMHGGGLVMGNADMNEARSARLASEINCIVVSVDYRLAPETKFPGPLEDCYAALQWMHREGARLGIDPSRLAVTGESAGGSLAAQLAFLVRDRKELSLKLQFLTYPMLDDRTGSTRDPGPLSGEFGWTRKSNVFGWTSYLGHAAGGEEAPTHPAVPARIEDVTGLAPMYLAVGALDLLADEAIEYARRLIAQGVPAELHVFPGAVHGFDNVPGTAGAKAYLEDRKRVFAKAFAK